ncbi:hypothetical protein CMI37_08135 [Candidatus Pacearchaeota archaeon]|nr:hypothetical protein [Candidatus Pacearchaeota archaeon]|tara:strand:+ start:327 stop:581 length:255 start_codon:yes stop_codon:yes gene_type:complete
MAIERSIEHDKIEVVGQYKAVQVREATVITEDDTEISRSFRRYVLHPDNDITDQTAEIQAICNAVWTDAVKTAWAEFQASQEAA